MTTRTHDIDIARYVRPFRLDAQHGAALAQQLVVAAPTDLSPRGTRALAKMERAAERVTTVLRSRSKTSASGLRAALMPFDAAYGALYGRLTSAAKLPEGGEDAGVLAHEGRVRECPSRARTAADRPREPINLAAVAEVIVAAVFADGLGFLVNDAETKYAESARRLGAIEEQKLAAEIDRVAGAPFLETVKVMHQRLGETLGLSAKPVRFARRELQDALDELRAAIAEHGLQLAAELDTDDPASVERFRAAVMPIDRFRAERAAIAIDATEDDAAPM